ncbi:hypothetical protein E6V34_09860 [Clostridium perfringens]
MNHNQGIECEVCKTRINLRIQVGMNKENKIKFLCPECGIPISCNMIFDFQNKGMNIIPKVDGTVKNANFITDFKNADYSIQCSSEYFTTKDIKNPYKDISINIFSPFIQSRNFFGKDNLLEFTSHANRIYMATNNINEFEKINFLYYSNKQYFFNEINKLFSKYKLEEIKDDEISKFRALYFYNINYFNQFLKKDEFKSINQNIIRDIKLIKDKNETEFFNMLSYFFKNNDFVEKYQTKVNKVINNYIKKFKYFIPAIGLEYLSSEFLVDDNISNEILDNYTIRTCTFDDTKTLYLETYENIVEVYDILIALNNIFHRDKFNSFKKFANMGNHVPKKYKNNPKLQINNFDGFDKLNKGLKLFYIEEQELFDKYMPILESKFRNSLGHENWEYDLKTQMIIYKDNQNNEYTYSLLEYTHQCYKIFVKLISLYKILVDMNNQYILIKDTL